MAYVDRASDSYFAESSRAGDDDARARAKAHATHMAAIESYVAAWHDGRISIEEKRRAISDENRMYYGASCPRRLLYP